MSPRQNLAQNIKNARKRLVLTQDKRAKKAEISVTNIRSLEHLRANPRLDTLERLAKALEMAVEELFHENETEE